MGYMGKTIIENIRFGKKAVFGPDELIGKIWLLAGSKNNRDSLAFLEDGLDGSVFVALNEGTQDLDQYTRISFHGAIRGWYWLPWLMRKLQPAFGKMIWRRWDHLIKAAGMEIPALSILTQYKPKALVFSNDHVAKTRALLWAAQQMDIPTIFIQHASVSQYFPPLNFDLNLLEGKQSLIHYQRCGAIPGRVELIGMPKFDRYFGQRNLSTKVNRIGLCANIFDQSDRLIEVLENLNQRFPDCQISFRLHPRDQRHFDLPAGVQLSDSKAEGIFDFLRRQDLIVAGDTSTHLEATLLNVSSIYHRFNDSFYDYYGYLANDMMQEAKTISELMDMIEIMKDNRPSVIHKAQHYNAVLNTLNDGKSSALAISYIREFLA